MLEVNPRHRDGVSFEKSGGPMRPTRHRFSSLGPSRCCTALLVVSISLVSSDAFAQDSDAGAGSTGGSASGAGAAGDSAVPAFPESDRDQTGTESATDAYSEPSPFSFGAASYAPGFAGCATDRGFDRSFGNQGLYTELTPPSGPADAGRYVRFSLGASETYTDNLNLESDDRAESDFITSISPEMNACAQTGRFRGSLVYQLQGVVYANNSRYNDVYNNVAGDTTIELIPGRLYLGADTSYGQSVVDPSISYSRSNIIRPGNKTSRWVTNISPFLFQPLGPLGDATLRYRFGKTLYGDSEVPDSTIHGGYFNLNSPADNQAWTWDLNAFTQRVERDGGDANRFFRNFDESEVVFDQNGNFILVDPSFEEADSSRVTYFDKATLEIGYKITRTLELLALGGLEDDYQDDGSNDRLGNTLWNVGFRWTSAFNTLEGRVGHRFFGTSYFLRATHDGRVLNASLGYTEEPSNQSLESLNSNATGRNPAASEPATSLFNTGVFVQKEVTGSLGFDMARTTTTLTGYHQRREFVQSGFADERFTGANLQIAYQLQPRTTLIPRGGWERRRARSSDSDTYDFGATLVRAITPTFQGAISYAHSLRNADDNGSDYNENRAVVQLLKNF